MEVKIEGRRWARTPAEALKLCEDGEYAVGFKTLDHYVILTANEVMVALMADWHIGIVCPHGDVFEFTATKKETDDERAD